MTATVPESEWMEAHPPTPVVALVHLEQVTLLGLVFRHQDREQRVFPVDVDAETRREKLDEVRIRREYVGTDETRCCGIGEHESSIVVQHRHAVALMADEVIQSEPANREQAILEHAEEDKSEPDAESGDGRIEIWVPHPSHVQKVGDDRQGRREQEDVALRASRSNQILLVRNHALSANEPRRHR